MTFLIQEEYRWSEGENVFRMSHITVFKVYRQELWPKRLSVKECIARWR